MVCVTGSNICPGLGLFNGSIGKVLDIVYAAGQSPNHNDLPLYVLVSFSLYLGKPFLSDRERVVPVVPVTVPCNNKKCPCTRTFIPLKLAFGKTCHTFQGQSAGEVDEGKPPNAVKRIICDPGTRAFEGINPGLFYTILSRATTLGDYNSSLSPQQRFKNSAIYFIGDNMNQHRITDITMQKNNVEYKMVQRRKRWVNYLTDNIITSTITPPTQEVNLRLRHH